jgi:hypothetical protein
MTGALTQCGGCTKPFVASDFHVKDDALVITIPCYHIFHIKCLRPWVNDVTKPCPNCNEKLYCHQVGKNGEQIAKVFLKAVKSHSPLVIETLNASDHQTGICTVQCQNEIPFVSVKWDQEKGQLFHEACCASKLPKLTLKDLGDVTQKVAEKDDSIKTAFTRTSLSSLQIGHRNLRIMRKEHPYLFATIAIELISIAALVLNRYKFEGENWPLYALSVPALITLTAAHQVAIAVIAVLNTHQA